MKKALVFLLVLVLVLLSSCDLPIPSGEEKPDEVSTAESITLKTATSFGGEDGNTQNYANMLEEFQKQYDYIHIEDTSAMSDEAWKSTIAKEFSTGSEPDVIFYFTGTDSNSMVEGGKYVSIEEIRTEYPEYGTNISEAAYTQTKSVDGKNYAVPVRGFWEAMFINRDVFDQCGVSVADISTWDGMMAACETFKAAGITPIAISLAEVPHYWFEYLLFNRTGIERHLSLPQKKNDDAYRLYVEVLNDFKTFYEKGYFPANTNTVLDNNTVRLFQEKKAAFLIDGSWKTATLSDQQHVELVNFPTRDESIRQSSDLIGGYSMGFIITRKAWDDETKRDAAVKFVEYMSQNAQIARFCSDGAAAPIAEEIKMDASPLVQSCVALTGAASGWVLPVQDTMPPDARTDLFVECIPKIVTGAMQPEEALDRFLSLSPAAEQTAN